MGYDLGSLRPATNGNDIHGKKKISSKLQRTEEKYNKNKTMSSLQYTCRKSGIYHQV